MNTIFPKREEFSKLELKDKNQKIPTLQEVLDLCKNNFYKYGIKSSNINEAFNQIIKLYV